MHARRAMVMVLTGLCAAAWIKTAGAYDFETELTTTTQGYQTRWFRFGEPDRFLNHRRFTQSLRLYIWDILAPARDPAYPDRPRRARADVYFASSLRIDEEFGEFTQGRVLYATSPTTTLRVRARVLLPELEAQNLQLDVLFAHVGVRRLFGFLDAKLGRQLEVDTLDWYSFDGVSVTAHTPWSLAVDAHVGLAVRGDLAGPVGSSTFALDGTSMSQCAELDAGLAAWTVGDECAQRRQLRPTFGFGAHAGVGGARLAVAYRRTMSPTASEEFPPGANAPAWGTNQEHVVASVGANLGRLSPWAAVRYSLLLARLDEVSAGLRLALGDHALVPEVRTTSPSFDGDSIFNVFSTEPTQELRLTYEQWPGRGRARAYSRAYVRRFQNSDADAALPGESVATSAYAGGAGLGLALRGDRSRARLDTSYEDGYGGLRVGADVAGRLAVRERLDLESRLTLVYFDAGVKAERSASFGAQMGLSWRFAEGVGVRVVAEENVTGSYGHEFRLMGILDLRFVPET